MQILNFNHIVNFYFMINQSYAQSYECDNQYEDCGTPDQSGGGGGGKGTILISNTDLGDSYQHADDYDDDGIEDSSDNCLRVRNPDQLDRDGDGIGASLKFFWRKSVMFYNSFLVLLLLFLLSSPL